LNLHKRFCITVPGALFWYALYRLQQHAQDAAFFGGNSGIFEYLSFYLYWIINDFGCVCTGAFSGADGSGTAGISLSGFDLSGIRWVLFPHVQFSSADPQSLQVCTQ
jgi:hypothetical protein